MVLPEQVSRTALFPRLPVCSIRPGRPFTFALLSSPPHPFAIPDDICHIFFFHTGRDSPAYRAAAGRPQCRPHLQQ